MTTKQQPSPFRKWDNYVKEASKPDFVIEKPDGSEIRISCPTGEQSLQAQRLAANGEPEEMIRLMCGDAADDLLPMILAAPAGVMNALAEDLMGHFVGTPEDQGNSPAS